MNTKNDSKVHVEEQTCFIEKGPLPMVAKSNNELKTSNLLSNGVKDDALLKGDEDVYARIPNNPNLEMTIWGNRKIHINKNLIPLRVSQFFWFAGGSLCSPFFVLMLTHRGLKLTEFSSIFSMIFLFQLTVAYICGIIVDKKGHAKLVLICLMLGVITVLIGLLFSPDVRDKLCLESDVNTSCFNIFNYTSDLDICKYVCSMNNTDYFRFQAVINNKTGLNASSNETEFLRSNDISEDAFYSNNTVILCSKICSCFDQFPKNCTATSKIGYKVLYSAVILCFFSFWSTVYRFLDFAALNLAKQENSNFGMERFFGMSGALVSTFLCNFVLNIDKSGNRGYYDNVYWFAIALNIIAVISAFNIREVRLPPGLNLTKKTLKMFTNIEIFSFTLIAFVAGSAYTFNFFYHLWFLDSLKASKRIIGVHIMTSSLYGFPILLTSKWWLRKLGRKTIVVIGLLAYAINGTSYSFLYYPWLSIVIQITKAFSFHLFWIALVVHCGEIAPKGFGATLNAVVGTIHFGIGRSFSVSVGGYLISTFGARTTYRILAAFCLVTAVLYTIFLYLRHFFATRSSEEQRKDDEEMKSMRENEA